MKTWIWSDLHISHYNVIEYESRPFQTVEEMNNHFIDNSKIVKKQETIFNLGDVSFKLNKDKLRSIITQMPGYKVLILGNHDRSKSVKWWESVGFNEVSKYPIIYKDFFILSHEPVYLNKHMPYVNIHGHTHSNNFEGSNYINVSVDRLGFKPALLNDIIDKLKEV